MGQFSENLVLLLQLRHAQGTPPPLDSEAGWTNLIISVALGIACDFFGFCLIYIDILVASF